MAELRRIRRLLSEELDNRNLAEPDSKRPSLPTRPPALDPLEPFIQPTITSTSQLSRPPLFGTITDPALPLGGPLPLPKPPLFDERNSDAAEVPEHDAADTENSVQETTAEPEAVPELPESTTFFPEQPPEFRIDAEHTPCNEPILTIANRRPISPWLEQVGFLMLCFGWLGMLAGLPLIVWSHQQGDALLWGIGIRGVCFGLGLIIIRLIGQSLSAIDPGGYREDRAWHRRPGRVPPHAE